MKKRIKQTLKGKRILITGASSGLGRDIAIESARRGASLILTGRNMKRLYETYEDCATLNTAARHYYLVSDFSRPGAAEDLCDYVDQLDEVVDVVVNCAGYGVFKEYDEFSYDEMRQMFEVNVLSLMLISQRMAMRMVRQGHGHIVNIASMAGKIATPKTTVYSATKFAVLGFSNALRLELAGTGVSVTTVNPGPMKTAFFEKADKSGRYLASLGNMTLDPKRLAHKIVAQFNHPHREINTPRIMEVAAVIYPVFPRVCDYLTRTIFNKK